MAFVETRPRQKIKIVSSEEADLLEAQKIIAAAGERNQKLKKELEQSIVTCIICGKSARYTRQGGWMQGIHHIFTCSDGHESPYRLREGKLEAYQWLIDQKKKGNQ